MSGLATPVFVSALISFLLLALVPSFGSQHGGAFVAALSAFGPALAWAGDDCKKEPDGTPCPDGNLCNGDETCVDGTCTPGDPLVCDDGSSCTDDLCDGGLGCLHVDNSAPCTDGNACTTHDTCKGGKCVGGSPNGGCSPCDAAATIPAAGGTFAGTTTGSSQLTGGTCSGDGGAPERVYRWTPNESGQVVVHTCSDATLFNTRVYVFQGQCPGPVIACNNDAAGCATGAPSSADGSKVELSVTAGETYFIVVDGFAGQAGAYSLFVGAPTVCGNGVREGGEQCDGADAGRCGSGTCGASCVCASPPGGLPDLEVEINNVSVALNATAASGDVAEGCAESTTGLDLLRFGVKSWNYGTTDLVLGDPMCPLPCVDHPLAVCGNPDFMCSPAAGHNHPHYANYARYELLDASGQALVVGHKQGHCLRDTDCATPVYTCTYQGLTVGCADEYGANLGCQYLDVTDVPDGNYHLRVTVDPFNLIGEVYEGDNVVERPVTIARNVPTRTPTPTWTTTPSGIPTPMPTETPTSTGTTTARPTPATETATATATVTATTTPIPVATKTATSIRTATPTRTATPARTPTRTRTVTPIGAATSTGTMTPAEMDTATPTATPTKTPTATPTPTQTASATPAALPSPTPTPIATAVPTSTVTVLPTPNATPVVIGCASLPLPGCRRALRPDGGTLRLTDRAVDKNDGVSWRWSRGAAVPRAAFGDPLEVTDYRLCVYDGAALVVQAGMPAGGICNTRAKRPCWRSVRHGFAYRNLDRTVGAIQSLDLREGASDGAARIALRGRGPLLGLPSLTSLTAPLTVQLQASNGACWQSLYSAPAGQHSAKSFVDKAD